MELQYDAADTVEPWAPAQPGPITAVTSRRFVTEPSDGPVGRAVTATLRWMVVAALVAVGYFGAAAINAGVELVQRDNAPDAATAPILAASSATK